MNKLHVDYLHYHDLISQVIGRVRDSGFQPDCVLGISRGGLFLADGLSRALRAPMAVVAASSYQGESGTAQGVLRVSTSIASVEPVQGRVLLVDDLVDSGQTLDALCAHLRTNFPEVTDLKTAVVWVKPTSVFKPDFAAVWMEQDVWIVQPFETRDFM